MYFTYEESTSGEVGAPDIAQTIIEKISKSDIFKPDPAPSEVDRLQGNVLLAIPPKFPPAFPCSIKVGDIVFFDYCEKIKKKAEILDNGDSIRITFKAAEDNSAIDTLHIPEQLM